MTVRRSALALALILVVAACGGDDVESAATTTTTDAATTTTESTVGDDEPCERDEASSLSADWATHDSPSGGFEFGYPDDWEDATGQAVVRAGEIAASETLEAAGIDKDDEIVYDLVRDPAGVNLSVSSIEGVDEALDVVYARQEAQTSRAAALEEMLGTELEACVDGDPALGFDFLFTAPREDTGEEATFYQRTWLVLHEDTLHFVQLLSLEENDSRIIDEALSTWRWVGESDDEAADDGEAAPAASFREAHLAAEVDTSADEPDPDTYTDAFAADEAAIFVVFLLDADAEVEIIWKREGSVLLRDSLQTPGERWAHHRITPPDGGFVPGQWEVELSIYGGDREVLPFTVTE